MKNIFRLDRTRKHVVVMSHKLNGLDGLKEGEKYTLQYCDDRGYPPSQSLQNRFAWYLTGLECQATVIRVSDALGAVLVHCETLEGWW